MQQYADHCCGVAAPDNVVPFSQQIVASGSIRMQQDAIIENAFEKPPKGSQEGLQKPIADSV
jgi:hypothetical protein